MSMNVCLDDVFWSADHFVTKLGMIMQQHEPECHAEKLVHCLQCQDHSEGIYDPVLLLVLGCQIAEILLNV